MSRIVSVPTVRRCAVLRIAFALVLTLLGAAFVFTMGRTAEAVVIGERTVGGTWACEKSVVQLHFENAPHRVINPPPERRHVPRYSMPFFLHLASDFLIETLPECVDAQHPNLYPQPISANDYLTERLIEIGLIKA